MAAKKKPAARGGAREGAGRKSEGLVSRAVRVFPGDIARWDALAERYQCSQADVVRMALSALEAKDK